MTGTCSQSGVESDSKSATLGSIAPRPTLLPTLNLNDVSFRIRQIRERDPSHSRNVIRYDLPHLTTSGRKHSLDIVDGKGNMCIPRTIDGGFRSVV